MQNTAKQNYPDLAAFYNIQPGNEIGLFYNAPEPTRGKSGGCTHRNRPDPTQEAVTWGQLQMTPLSGLPSVRRQYCVKG